MVDFPDQADFRKTDAELMQQFVLALQDLLEELVDTNGRRNPGDKSLFPRRLRQFMGPAFAEIRPIFAQLENSITNIPRKAVETHGLYGNQLKYKLSVTRYWFDHFQRKWRPSVLRRLLDALEGLLDSIIDATGVGGAIKEFKEALRNSSL